MNREEAIDVFEKIKAYYKSDPNWGVYDGVFSRQKLTEILDAYAALHSPQPDPITGLVPCGCGGKAETHELFGEYSGTYMTDCKECATGTTQYNTEKESQDAWNTAMAYKGGAE